MSNALIVGAAGWDLGARWWKAGRRQTSLLWFAPSASSRGAGRAPAAGAKQTPAPSPSRSPPALPKAGNRGGTVRKTGVQSHRADGCTDQFETGLVPVPQDLRSSHSWGSCRTHLPLPALLLGLCVCRDVHTQCCALAGFPHWLWEGNVWLSCHSDRHPPSCASSHWGSRLPRPPSLLHLGTERGRRRQGARESRRCVPELGGSLPCCIPDRDVATQHPVRGKSRCAASQPANS